MTDDQVKQIIRKTAAGGIPTLQKALGVPADGIIGKQTNDALTAIELDVLLSNILKQGSTKFNDLRQDYEQLYKSMVILDAYKTTVTKNCQQIVANKDRYIEVEKTTDVPWYVIGIIHLLECSLNFTKHLHNGDPLNKRTVNVPSGRPKGDPPFTWYVSAVDALVYSGLNKWTEWTPAGVAYTLELYNGFGYRLYTNINSPYLWSYTNHYMKGKYGSDGKFNPNLVSKQCGGIPLLKCIMEMI